MRIFGIILAVVSLAIFILGIRTTTLIHNYNMANPTGTPKGDLGAILLALIGATALIVGVIISLRPISKKKNRNCRNERALY